MRESRLTKKDNIFINRFALSINYIPEQLIGRDDEIDEIESLVEPILSNSEPKNALVTGLTGVGKTVVIGHVMSTLLDVTKDFDLNVKIVNINCKQDNTDNRIIVHIINDIDPTNNIPKQGLSKSQYLDYMWEILSRERIILIAILDEIHVLKSTDILYHLSRPSQFKKSDNYIFIGIIGISNDISFLDNVESSILSSFGERHLIFSPYGEEQLVEILKNRVPIAFKEGVVMDGVLELCARYSDHGDARTALEILDAAGEMAKNENCGTIQPGHVKMAYNKVNTDALFKLVKELPIQTKIVLVSTLIANKIHPNNTTTGNVEKQYKEYADHLGVEILTRTSISKHITKLDTIGVIDASIATKNRMGITRIITINFDSEELGRALFQDFRLSPLALQSSILKNFPKFETKMVWDQDQCKFVECVIED